MKTHCKRGHEYTPANTALQKTGRLCRKCAAMKAEAYRQRYPEKIEKFKTTEYRRPVHSRYYRKNVAVLADKQRARRRTDGGRRTMAAWFQRKYYQDQNFNLAKKMRRRMYVALAKSFSGIRSRGLAINILGCSFDELRVHIESQFTPGMTWEMCFSGEIHLDHKRPCASFDMTDPGQLKQCFHYKNLQPLWARDNLIKKDKYAA